MSKEAPDYIGAEKVFLYTFGSALMNWSYVEHRLLWWFWHLSGMTEGAARAVYFSGRSFKARSELIQSLMRCGEFPDSLTSTVTHPLGLAFLADSLRKADGYCGFRNALAHGISMTHTLGSETSIKIRSGGVDYAKAVETAIGIDRLIIADRNFERLSQLIANGYYVVSRQNHNLERLQELHGQLLLLPSQPDCEKLSRKQLGRQRQRGSERRKASKTALVHPDR